MKTFRISSLLLALLSAAASAGAEKGMPAARQNDLVAQYCAVCHTNAASAGGLSLQQFDATRAAPSLSAMILSKLTGGVPLATARQAQSNPAAAALVHEKLKTGAIGASGIQVPDMPTIQSFIDAFTTQSAGATEWTVEDSGGVITASVLREAAVSAKTTQVQAYRLVVSCNPTSHDGSMQLVWSPQAQSGTITAAADGQPSVRLPVDGSAKMANAGLLLTGIGIPNHSLTILDLFPKDAVMFSFSDFPRGKFAACF